MGTNDGRIGYPNLLSLGNMDGFLGNGSVATPEPPLLGGDIDVGTGRTVLTASAGDTTTCVLLDNLTVRCWGSGPIVGQGITTVVGDDETPGDVPVINYNGSAKFVPLSPARILDTRPGLPAPAGSPKGLVSPDGSVDVQVTGEGGVPDTGVYAVVLNVTMARASARGFVTAYPTGTSRPEASNINVTAAGQNAPNSVIVPVGAGGKVTLYTSGGGHLVADVFGYFEQIGSATAGRLIGVSPSRVFDTRPERPDPGPKGKLGAGDTIEVAVTGRNGVPTSGVSAVVLNVTAANATARGFITVFPGDEDLPETSNLNLSRPLESRPNTVIVPVSPTGTIKLYSSSGAHLLADVSGYFTDDTAEDTDDGLFVPLSPARLLDSRATGKIPPGVTTDFAVTGRLGISSTANAVVLNLTAVKTTGFGYVTGWPSDESQPGSSNLNVREVGINIANLAVLPIGCRRAASACSRSAAPTCSPTRPATSCSRHRSRRSAPAGTLLHAMNLKHELRRILDRTVSPIVSAGMRSFYGDYYYSNKWHPHYALLAGGARRDRRVHQVRHVRRPDPQGCLRRALDGLEAGAPRRPVP